MVGTTIVCAGRVYCDLIFTGLPHAPSAGREVFADALSIHAGGGAATTAAWLSSLGRPAALSSVMPAAPFDDPVRCDLRRAAVDLSLCSEAAGDEPQLTVAMVYQEDRAFLTRAPGAALPQLTPHDLKRLDARHLHVGELRTLIERPDLIGIARSAGVTISADCGWDETVDAECAPLIAALDLFLPNEDEARFLTRLGLDPRPAPLTVIKRGASGADALTEHRHITRPAPKVAVVDTTGAGDAFNAGFVDAWLGGASIEHALDQGNMCGARAVTVAGGMAAAIEGMAA